MNSYTRLRELGVSVETADAVSSVVDALPCRWQEAVYLRLSGYTYSETAMMCRMSMRTISKITECLRISNNSQN